MKIEQPCQEEILAHELIHYIESDAEHGLGICNFVTVRARVYGHPLNLEPSEVASVLDAMTVLRKQSKTAARIFGSPNSVYIRNTVGRTPERVEFAKLMLRAVEVGHLRYNTKTGAWVGRAR